MLSLFLWHILSLIDHQFCDVNAAGLACRSSELFALGMNTSNCTEFLVLFALPSVRWCKLLQWLGCDMGAQCTLQFQFLLVAHHSKGGKQSVKLILSVLCKTTIVFVEQEWRNHQLAQTQTRNHQLAQTSFCAPCRFHFALLTVSVPTGKQFKATAILALDS